MFIHKFSFKIDVKLSFDIFCRKLLLFSCRMNEEWVDGIKCCWGVGVCWLYCRVRISKLNLLWTITCEKTTFMWFVYDNKGVSVNVVLIRTFFVCTLPSIHCLICCNIRLIKCSANKTIRSLKLEPKVKFDVFVRKTIYVGENLSCVYLSVGVRGKGKSCKSY